MISEFNFFSEFNFLIKNEDPFVVFKKPSHNKIICWQGNVSYLSLNEINKEKGFLFMPFNHDSKGLILTPSKITETEFYLDRRFEMNSKIKIDNFLKKRKSHIESIENAINQINSTDLEKVVCSSTFNLSIDSKKYVDYFKKLIQLNHDAFCYFFYDPNIGIWTGASPEKLISTENGYLTTCALAATKKDLNQTWSDKEFREQKIVEEQIIKDLKGSCNDLEIGVLQTVKAGTLYHLKTLLKAKTNYQSTVLINKLHPTPAVAGTPKDLAIKYINDFEDYDRSYYTGYLGFIDNYDCDIYVNIRCAKILNNDLTLYVGGGITKDSNPIDEWNEIINKSQIMLNVFHEV